MHKFCRQFVTFADKIISLTYSFANISNFVGVKICFLSTIVYLFPNKIVVLVAEKLLSLVKLMFVYEIVIQSKEIGEQNSHLDSDPT